MLEAPYSGKPKTPLACCILSRCPPYIYFAHFSFPVLQIVLTMSYLSAASAAATEDYHHFQSRGSQCEIIVVVGLLASTSSNNNNRKICRKLFRQWPETISSVLLLPPTNRRLDKLERSLVCIGRGHRAETRGKHSPASASWRATDRRRATSWRRRRRRCSGG